MRQKAFTLAEVLITLGIIGIVATMTIPNLIFKYRKSVSVAKLKRTYSTLQQALIRTLADSGGYNYVNFSDGNTQSMIDWYEHYLKPNLKPALHTQALRDNLFRRHFRRCMISAQA